eukprot:evm.model.scf_2159.1 EVM.evm.TU.scf_2159.1   scf_2159:12915-14681(-)
MHCKMWRLFFAMAIPCPPSPGDGHEGLGKAGQLSCFVAWIVHKVSSLRAIVFLVAFCRGLCLYVRMLGLFFRVVCRQGNEDGDILGYTNGFVLPWMQYMHCDTLQVFKGKEKTDLAAIGPLSVALMLGAATFCFGVENGCKRAEILSVRDNDVTAERLVRFYKYFGFKPIREVGGNGLADVPDMLMWGAEGTKMEADIEQMLSRWTSTIRYRKAGSGK